MDQRVHFITIAVADLDLARRFYTDGLGWTATLDVPGEIIFFQVGPGLLLGLFDAPAFTAEFGSTPATETTPSGFTLSHNVPSPEDVDRVMRAAAAAGATIVKPPQPAAFGGYHGYYADPNGTAWEVACNPGWRIDEDGRVLLGPVEDG